MTTDPATPLQKKYDDIHDAIDFEYRGYRIGQLTASFLSALLFRRMPKKEQWRFILIKGTLIRRLDDMPAIDTGVLFSFPEWTNRKDYLEICDYVRSQVKDAFFLRLSLLRHRPVFKPRHLRRAMSVCRRLRGLGFTGRAFMTAILYNTLIMIDEAERCLGAVKTKKYVSFSCVMGIEHLLTQYFRKNGIPTYNLQHGVTTVYQKNPQDALEYTNIISDHHLAWGDYTRDELLKYGFEPRRVLAAGYPRQQQEMPVQKPRSRHCVVFLSRQHFNRANLALLSILSGLAQDGLDKNHFYLKLHPSLSMSAYRKWIHDNCPDGNIDLLEEDMTLQEVLTGVSAGFCIVVNSSAYYESYMHGLVALRYHSPDFDTEYPVADDLFSTRLELLRLLQALYGAFEEHFPAEKIRRALKYVLGLPGNEYGRILNG